MLASIPPGDFYAVNFYELSIMHFISHKLLVPLVGRVTFTNRMRYTGCLSKAFNLALGMQYSNANFCDFVVVAWMEFSKMGAANL